MASGLPSPCPGCDLHSCVPWRPHTQRAAVFFDVFAEGKGNLGGILQKLQNARLLIPGYGPFHSLSRIQPVVHPSGSRPVGGSLHLTLPSLVSVCLIFSPGFGSPPRILFLTLRFPPSSSRPRRGFVPMSILFAHLDQQRSSHPA